MIGPTRMIIAVDDEPDDDAGEARRRLPVTAAPNTVNTRIAVPMTSARKPTMLPALALTLDRAQAQRLPGCCR